MVRAVSQSPAQSRGPPLPRAQAVVGWKSPSSKAEHTNTPPALTDTPRNTHGVTQMNLVFRYGAAPAEEEQPRQQPRKRSPALPTPPDSTHPPRFGTGSWLATALPPVPAASPRHWSRAGAQKVNNYLSR